MKKPIYLIIFALLLNLLISAPAWAVQPFTVRHVQVEGLQRVTRDTLMSYLSVTPGTRLTAQQSAKIIRALHETGFFSDIRLLRHGNDLLVRVREYPVISQINITGNEAITDENLAPVLKEVGLVKGRAFNPMVIKQFAESLRHQYRMQSRYAAIVETSVVPASHHRVIVGIHITEGVTAKVHSIHISGNKVFSQRKLIRQMSLSTWRPWSFFTESDEYAEQKLQADLNTLQSFYMDRGYLKFAILKHQVTFDEDKRHVDIHIQVSEGKVYKIKTIEIKGGLTGQADDLHRFVTLKPGDIFSRERLMKTREKISQVMQNQGFAMVKIAISPQIDDHTHQVAVTFTIQAGKRVTVRRIHFLGNTRTAEYVLRRQMRQLEGSTFSYTNIQESKRRLANLGYLDNLQVKPTSVAGHPDQVDLEFSMKEASSASANVQVGLSDIDGWLYGAHLDQHNFMGTGRAVSLALDNSEYSHHYSFSYTNPYLTPSGVSRGFGLYYQKMTPGKANLTTYKTDTYGANVHYGIPWSRYARLFFSYGYEHIQLKIGDKASDEVKDFIAEHGNRFDQFRLQAGWNYSSLNRLIFPTKGLQQHITLEVGLPLTGNSLDYYTATYSANWYQPLLARFLLRFHTQLAYGRGYGQTGSALPFFKNFYAGGIGSVRAFRGNSIGPRDSTERSIGGNLLTVANIDFILPPYFTPKVRTSFFFDVGSVGRDKVGDLRYSAGITVKWRSPMAPLVFSFGKAFSPKHHNSESFQFSIGTGL